MLISYYCSIPTNVGLFAKRINNQRFRWLGHVVRMDEDAPPRRVFDAVVGVHRRVGRPRTRWKEHVEETLNSSGVIN